LHYKVVNSMAENIIDFSDIVDKQVYTEEGSYCGEIKDVEMQLGKFAVRAVVVAAEKGSYLAEKVGGAKNVVIPYRMIDSIDDIIVMKDFETNDAEEEE
jgi:sporulation protein YlmC with PRC-barrel domain